MKYRRQILIVALIMVAGGPLFAPQLLAFPYKAQIGADRIYATAPFSQPQLAAVLADANRRVARSPLAQGTEGRSIYLTDGGWRWQWLANASSGAFALTRPLSEAVVVNRTDTATARVSNGTPDHGQRTLASIIAHEKCHGMERRHFGLTVDATKPQWLREGYCDYVAGESTLSDADAAALVARHEGHPALPYYQGRKRVEAALAANGGNVDRLFDEAR